MLPACRAVLALMVGISLLADRRLPPAARLPMQWGIRGQVDWTAPRAVALGFTPVMAALLLALAMLAARQDAGDRMAPLVLMAVSLGAHLLHLLHMVLLRRRLLRARGA